MQVIEATGLRKEYSGRAGSVVAVDDLDLSVEGPGVHGFLGPNGSGKTTTIRCLLGLIRPTKGSVRILGADVSELDSVIDRVGALVETPKFFPNFTGRKNLRMLGTVAGIDNKRVDAALETVGLGDRSKDTFQSYSLGMKQRLAVGATLLKDPDLILLDEPANGLDPAGIVEIRLLLRSLAEQGKTIFVSSHQLAEVQQTCDVLTIISEGRVIASGSVDDVLASAGKGLMKAVITDAPGALEVLLAAGFSARLGTAPEVIEIDIDPMQGALIVRHLAAAGRFPRSLQAEGASLESVFLSLTGPQKAPAQNPDQR